MQKEKLSFMAFWAKSCIQQKRENSEMLASFKDKLYSIFIKKECLKTPKKKQTSIEKQKSKSQIVQKTTRKKAI